MKMITVLERIPITLNCMFIVHNIVDEVTRHQRAEYDAWYHLMQDFGGYVALLLLAGTFAILLTETKLTFRLATLMTWITSIVVAW